MLLEKRGKKQDFEKKILNLGNWKIDFFEIKPIKKVCKQTLTDFKKH